MLAVCFLAAADPVLTRQRPFVHISHLQGTSLILPTVPCCRQARTREGADIRCISRCPGLPHSFAHSGLLKSLF